MIDCRDAIIDCKDTIIDCRDAIIDCRDAIIDCRDVIIDCRDVIYRLSTGVLTTNETYWLTPSFLNRINLVKY